MEEVEQNEPNVSLLWGSSLIPQTLSLASWAPKNLLKAEILES